MAAYTNYPQLDRHVLVRRTGANRIELDELVRWAAPLDVLVRRTLASDLAARLPDGMVVLPGQARRPMRRVVVVLETFSPGPAGHVELVAHWSIVDTDSRDVVERGRSRITVDAGGSGAGAVATAMSEALGRLADRTSAVLVREGRPGAAGPFREEAAPNARSRREARLESRKRLTKRWT